MAEAKKSKVFYFVVKPGESRNLEAHLMKLGYIWGTPPDTYVDRYVLGRLEPGGESLIKGQVLKCGETIDGFVEFNKELDLESDSDLKAISKCCGRIVPYKEGSPDFTCSAAFKIRRDRTVSIFNSKRRCEFTGEDNDG